MSRKNDDAVMINQEWLQEVLDEYNPDEFHVLIMLVYFHGHPLEETEGKANAKDVRFFKESLAKFVEAGYLAIDDGVVRFDPYYVHPAN